MDAFNQYRFFYIKILLHLFHRVALCCFRSTTLPTSSAWQNLSRKGFSLRLENHPHANNAWCWHNKNSKMQIKSFQWSHNYHFQEILPAVHKGALMNGLAELIIQVLFCYRNVGNFLQYMVFCKPLQHSIK